MNFTGFSVKTAAIRLNSKFAEAGEKMQRAETGRPKSAQERGWARPHLAGPDLASGWALAHGEHQMQPLLSVQPSSAPDAARVFFFVLRFS